jgi:hypothetical protein
MTLAAIFLAVVSAMAGTSTARPIQQTQPQNTPADAKPAASTASTPAAPTPKNPAVRRKRKKIADCGAPGSDSSAANQATRTTGATAPSGAQGSTPGNSPAAKNCPPEKKIVLQGGTSEPSIELAGPGGGEASQKKDSANQMLGSTEDNLKKLAGHQLSPSEQDTVTQIRQFMQQSKDAIDAGDLERAHTLAWKAKVLSDALANPQK